MDNLADIICLAAFKIVPSTTRVWVITQQTNRKSDCYVLHIPDALSDAVQ